MTTQVGRGEHFREASWLERGIARLRGARTRPAPAVLRRLHEVVLDLLPGDHLVSTLPGGERVRVSARYRHLSWNPEEYAAFKAAVRPGATVLDVGANVGAYTVLFALWTGASGRVVAFEPSPRSIDGLREHVRLNGLADRVEIVEAAVSSSVGSASFDCGGASGANGLVADAAAGADVVAVKTTSLDAFCHTRGLRASVIKIDVEGAELDVLRGGRQTLAQPGLDVFVEFHPSIWAQRGITRAAIEAELAAQGLRPEPLHPSLDIWNTEGISVRLRRI
jgi:FkbM family methyltransferase